ncbi:hypothetical protein AAD018_011990 [Aestuariibius insulae]|uniref:hypothetical protein n=1 Tax=Aestuariibius insulae TaxID=2058287 RepID=UPI00345E2771
MDNNAFIERTSLVNAKIVDLDLIDPMSVWKTFIMMADEPDLVVEQSDIEGFSKAWRQFFSDPRAMLYLNIGGDSSGNWIIVEANELEKIWERGYPADHEIDCAILAADKDTIVGITFEEGDRFAFFKRSLSVGEGE